MCSLRFATVRDLRRCSRTDGGGRRCTPVNETENETRRRATAGRCGVVLHDLIPQTREQAPPLAGVMQRAGRDVTRSLLGTGAAIRRRRRCCGTGCNASKAPSASERSKARQCGCWSPIWQGIPLIWRSEVCVPVEGLLLAVCPRGGHRWRPVRVDQPPRDCSPPAPELSTSLLSPPAPGRGRRRAPFR